MAGLVSIIIPCFNSLPFLKETLTCAFNQTYPNIEIIVIDDNSTDGSYEYLQSLNKPNLILAKNKGKGACAARNYGLELAKGYYIQFLDADDLLSPDKIEKQVIRLQTLDRNTVASCGWVHFSNKADIDKYQPQKIDLSYSAPTEWLKDSWSGEGMTTIHSWLIPRLLIAQAGSWDEELIKNQDGEFMARILCHASSIVFLEDIYSFYRKPAATNISQNKSKEAIESVLKSYKLYEYVLQFRDDEPIKKALANNYNHFIYVYYNTYPNLSKKAEQYVLELGQEVKIPFSNSFWHSLSRLFGWRGVMKIRKVMKGY